MKKIIFFNSYVIKFIKQMVKKIFVNDNFKTIVNNYDFKEN